MNSQRKVRLFSSSDWSTDALDGSTPAVQCDTKTRVFCEEETKQKKRVLAEYLRQQRETKDVSKLLEGSEFAMTKSQNRRKMLTDLQAYDEVVRKAPKDVQSKKKKQKKANCKNIEFSCFDSLYSEKRTGLEISSA